MQKFISKYKHGWIFSYMIIYFYWFFALEKRGSVPMKTIHIAADDFFPFNEWFLIPYLLWFGYITLTVLYFFFQPTKRTDFYQVTAFLFLGMSICLFIYTFWPNCQNLRPTYFVRDNFMVHLVQGLYRIDTSTNVP